MQLLLIGPLNAILECLAMYDMAFYWLISDMMNTFSPSHTKLCLLGLLLLTHQSCLIQKTLNPIQLEPNQISVTPTSEEVCVQILHL